jgi:hypothetical protein
MILVSLISATASAQEATHYCYQTPVDANSKFEAGYLNCDLDKSGHATPQDICLEAVKCIFLTPNNIRGIEALAKEFGEKKTSLNQMDADTLGKIMYHDVMDLHHPEIAFPSILVCKHKGLRCQTVDECQGPLLYHLTVETPAKAALGFSPDALQNHYYQTQPDGQIAPVPSAQ